MGTTYRELRRECAPWSERCLEVVRGKRIGNSDRSECSNKSCDASGHSADAGRSTVHSPYNPCGRRIVRHPRGLWVWRRSGSRAVSTQTLGPLDDWKSERIAQRHSSPGRTKLVELQGAVERLEDLMRRYTQRRDARNGQRHTLAEDIRMAALEAFLPENSSDTVNSNGHGWIRIKS